MEATGQPSRESLSEGGGVKYPLGQRGHAQQAQCSRIATARFAVTNCAGKGASDCGLSAGPQSADWERWAFVWFEIAAGFIG